MLNVNRISVNAANKLHIYLFFNDISEFASISPVFQCLELNYFLRAAENSSNLNLVGPDLFLL